MGVTVAPRAGAWIETDFVRQLTINGIKSHPVRVRGLKLSAARWYSDHDLSHPVRVRGLKQIFRIVRADVLVAPRAGAWIETADCLVRICCHLVAPRAGAWIETAINNGVVLDTGRTPCGCVD